MVRGEGVPPIRQNIVVEKKTWKLFNIVWNMKKNNKNGYQIMTPFRPPLPPTNKHILGKIMGFHGLQYGCQNISW